MNLELIDGSRDNKHQVDFEDLIAPLNFSVSSPPPPLNSSLLFHLLLSPLSSSSSLSHVHVLPVQVSFVHNVHPGDTVGALTFVTNLEENIAGNLEAVRLRGRERKGGGVNEVIKT